MLDHYFSKYFFCFAFSLSSPCGPDDGTALRFLNGSTCIWGSPASWPLSPAVHFGDLLFHTPTLTPFSPAASSTADASRVFVISNTATFICRNSVYVFYFYPNLHTLLFTVLSTSSVFVVSIMSVSMPHCTNSRTCIISRLVSVDCFFSSL